MVPSPTLNRAILGVLGRAQRLYPIQIHAYCFLSSHYHLLVTADDALQLAEFMNHLNSNLAREIAHLTGWTDKIWSRRYEAIQVSDEIEAQVDRKSVRRALYESFSLFVTAYRAASEKLRSGDHTARFPTGCFPPGLPFVDAAA
jgi:REP element-mobilizing transposase RayT